MLVVLLLSLASAPVSAQDATVSSDEPTIAPPEPIVDVPPAPDPARLRDYKRKHLTRGRSQLMTSGAIPVTSHAGNGLTFTTYAPFSTTTDTWGVYDGGGTPYAPADFARMTGDSATLRRVSTEKKRARKAVGWMIGGGAAAAIVGVAVMAGREEVPPFMVSSEFDSLAEKAAYDAERDAIRDRNSARGLRGGLLLTTGATVGLCSIAVPMGLKTQQKQLPRYYSPDEADAWIERYNAKLRDRLGLTEQDVQSIDLQGRAPTLTLQPALGLAWAGVNGSF